MTLKNSTMATKSFLTAEFTNRWNKFRETLRREDQIVWDEMWKATDIHRNAINAMTGVSEFEKEFMAMMIKNHKDDDEIDAKISEIEKRIAVIVGQG